MEKRKFVYGPTTISYIIYERQGADSPCRNSFLVDDIFAILPDCKNVVVIHDIFTEFSCRGKLVSKEAVDKFISYFEDKMPIALNSCLSRDYFPIEPTAEQYAGTLEWQAKYVEKLGFTNINEFVGYECSEAFIYETEITAPFMNFITEDEVDTPTESVTFIDATDGELIDEAIEIMKNTFEEISNKYDSIKYSLNRIKHLFSLEEIIVEEDIAYAVHVQGCEDYYDLIVRGGNGYPIFTVSVAPEDWHKLFGWLTDDHNMGVIKKPTHFFIPDSWELEKIYESAAKLYKDKIDREIATKKN